MVLSFLPVFLCRIWFCSLESKLRWRFPYRTFVRDQSLGRDWLKEKWWGEVVSVKARADPQKALKLRWFFSVELRRQACHVKWPLGVGPSGKGLGPWGRWLSAVMTGSEGGSRREAEHSVRCIWAHDVGVCVRVCGKCHFPQWLQQEHTSGKWVCVDMNSCLTVPKPLSLLQYELLQH